MKKQTPLLLLFIFFVSIIKSQSWTTTGNSTGAGAILGTTSNQPINFYTSGTKKATLTTGGVLNIGGLAGTGSRFLQTNSSGDLIEWTGSGGDNNKALFGDNTFKTLPFTFESTKMSINNGVKLGIGTTDPTAELHVIGDAKLSGKVTASNGFMLNATDGISYSSTNNTIIFGKLASGGNTPLNSCYTLPSGFTWSQADGYSCFKAPSGSQVNATLRMYISPTTGGGYLEVDGVDNNNAYNVLNINTNCGRNTNINTGTNGGNVNIGSSVTGSQVNFGHFVKMLKHLEIGDVSAGILSAPTNVALDLHVNSGKGLKVRTTSNNGTSGYNTDDMITVETTANVGFGTNAYKMLNVNSDGKTIINSLDFTSFVIKDINISTNPETFRLYADGLTEILPQNSKALSILNPSNSNGETFSIDRNGYTEIKVRGTMPNSYGSSPRVFTVRDMTIANGKDIFVVKADGKVYAREVEINLTTNFPDYVFDKSYNLKSIPELASYIKTEKHLPGFESAEHYEKNGLNVNSMIVKQQEKIEELILYIIQLEERIRSIEKSK